MTKEIAVIGGGAVGLSTAWHLASNGHEVMIIDPVLRQPMNRSRPLNGTTASLGILMGYVFRRSSGRSWRLRKRSMELWQDWIDKLNTKEIPLKLDSPLVQLAASEQEAAFMQKLSNARANLGLEYFPKTTSSQLGRLWPSNTFGGLISHKDGQIDPLKLQQSLLNALDTSNVHKIHAKNLPAIQAFFI